MTVTDKDFRAVVTTTQDVMVINQQSDREDIYILLNQLALNHLGSKDLVAYLTAYCNFDWKVAEQTVEAWLYQDAT